MPDFLETYKVDLADPYYGFKSWNDFFARKLKDDTVRPIYRPDDPYSTCSPCDAFPYFIERKSKLRDEFWIKSQPYSLQHLLNDDALTEKYVGGTVFQAFLDTACQLPSLACTSCWYNNQGIHQGRCVLCRSSLDGL